MGIRTLTMANRKRKFDEIDSDLSTQLSNDEIATKKIVKRTFASNRKRRKRANASSKHLINKSETKKVSKPKNEKIKKRVQTTLNFPSKSKNKKDKKERIGASECSECGMLYYSGNDDDDSVHSKFHKIFIQKFKNGYKKKQHLLSKFIIFESAKYLVLCIEYEQFLKLKEANADILSVCDLMDRDLGYFVSHKEQIYSLEQGQSLFCFVEETRHCIVGCVVCEYRTFAYQIKINSESMECDFIQRSSKKEKCQIGVVKIWVHPSHRRKGIGSLLMDCIQTKFVYATKINKKYIAFCQPTRCGKQFAQKYCKTKHILVY